MPALTLYVNFNEDAALLKSDVHQKVVLVWLFIRHMVFSTSAVLLTTKRLRGKKKKEKPNDIN
jgi:hypothetical protein